MKLGLALVVIVAVGVISIAWLVKHPLAPDESSVYEPPAPAPVVKKPEPVQRKVVKHAAPAAVPELPPVAEVPLPAPVAVAETPRPFPDAAQIPIGVDKAILSPFHQPTLRTIAVEHRQLKETYVYCPGGATDTWVLLKNGKVVEKFDLEHTPAEP